VVAPLFSFLICLLVAVRGVIAVVVAGVLILIFILFLFLLFFLFLSLTSAAPALFLAWLGQVFRLVGLGSEFPRVGTGETSSVGCS
jgi:hypothetical protein